MLELSSTHSKEHAKLQNVTFSNYEGGSTIILGVMCNDRSWSMKPNGYDTAPYIGYGKF